MAKLPELEWTLLRPEHADFGKPADNHGNTYQFLSTRGGNRGA
jgi:hypothetical protein